MHNNIKECPKPIKNINLFAKYRAINRISFIELNQNEDKFEKKEKKNRWIKMKQNCVSFMFNQYSDVF